MIDHLTRVARGLRPLRNPAIVVGLASLSTIVVVLLSSESHAEDRLLMPCFVVLLWATSIYSFVEIFRDAPERARKGLGITENLRRRIKRAWFWLLGALFLGATAAAFYLSYRLMFIWIDEY